MCVSLISQATDVCVVAPTGHCNHDTPYAVDVGAGVYQNVHKVPNDVRAEQLHEEKSYVCCDGKEFL